MKKSNGAVEALERAIESAGGAAALARHLNVTVQAVCGWKKCPPKRAIAVEKACKGRVTREELCPEVFGHRIAA